MDTLINAIKNSNISEFRLESIRILTDFAYKIGLSDNDFDIINDDSWAGTRKQVSLNTDFISIKIYINPFCEFNLMYYKSKSRLDSFNGREKKCNINELFSTNFINKMVKYKEEKINKIKVAL